MLAVEVPVLKTVVLGGVALGMAALLHHPHAHASKHRLSLHAPVRADALYLTVFADGDIEVARDDANLRPLTFTTRAFINDGCEWLGIERLTPIDATRYAYSYDESILQCMPDAHPCIKTPRTGIVTVDE
ncbi:MAG: hypothetical protein ACM31C_25250 [Acidobacteriota bacterium]